MLCGRRLDAAMPRPSIAIGTAFSLMEGRYVSILPIERLAGACGMVKWCHNAARLAALPSMRGRAEVVVWSDKGGAALFAREMCAPFLSASTNI